MKSRVSFQEHEFVQVLYCFLNLEKSSLVYWKKGRMYFLHYWHDLICILLFYTQRQAHASRIFFHSPYCFHVTVTHTWFKNEVIWSSQLAISLRSLSFLYYRRLWYLSLLPQKLRVTLLIPYIQQWFKLPVIAERCFGKMPSLMLDLYYQLRAKARWQECECTSSLSGQSQKSKFKSSPS